MIFVTFHDISFACVLLEADPYAGCPKEIFSLKTLVRLNLSFQGFNRLTERIEELQLLEELNLSHNPVLEALPGEISGLSNLKGKHFSRDVAWHFLGFFDFGVVFHWFWAYFYAFLGFYNWNGFVWAGLNSENPPKQAHEFHLFWNISKLVLQAIVLNLRFPGYMLIDAWKSVDTNVRMFYFVYSILQSDSKFIICPKLIISVVLVTFFWPMQFSQFANRCFLTSGDDYSPHYGSEIEKFSAMFPLSCARVRTHRSWGERTQETSEHTTKFPFRKVFAHISCSSSHIQTSPGKCCTKEILCAHRL